MHHHTSRAAQIPRRRDTTGQIDRIDLLDKALFDGHRWFAIDANNRRVPGVVVATLPAGLNLIGRGPVATLVGRLRPGFVAVDVDAGGTVGEAITEHLAGWAERAGQWVLVRPSGGGPGRAHIIIAPGRHRDELDQLVADLRHTYQVPATAIDVRTALRPLSAPHRTGTRTRPYGNLPQLAKTIPRPGSKTASTAARAPRSHARVAPLAPRMRRRRDLPEPWQQYLSAGRTPPIGGGTDRSRSTVEAIATGHMVRAGWSADEAWQAISTAHPGAMTRARANRRRWVQWVWNRAVEDDPAPTGPSEPIRGAVTAARERLHQLQWTVPPRQRAALVAVGHAICDRIWRTGTCRVPVPERDLVLDTGIQRRPTIRKALAVLTGADGLGVLHTEPYRPTDKDSSYEFELAPQFRVWQMSPPSTHTPSPSEPNPLPPATWHALPRAARLLWHQLHQQPNLPLDELTRLAGLPPTPHAAVSPSHRRTIRKVLLAMAHADLVQCDADGRWTAHTPEQAADDTAYQQAAGTVAEERRAWRSASTWHQQRRAAMAADHARYHRWWNRLTPAQRQQRQRQYRDLFDASSIRERHRLKTRLARSRMLAGISEADRHQQWCASLSDAEWERRSITRAAAYAALPRPEQVAAVGAWEDHRQTWTIPRGRPTAPERREAVAA